jgi:hypothetical protein
MAPCGQGGPRSDSIRLDSVTLDCPDAGLQAAFYADIIGGEMTFLNEAWPPSTARAGGSTSRPPQLCAADLARPDIVDADAS